MRTDTTYQEPNPELRRRTIPAGEARVAVFTRSYETTVEDLWDACNMGTGTILVCEPPRLLKLSLGAGADEIELHLSANPEDGTTTLELQHATTLDSHNIGGETFDAIFCMGGGYYPRLLALDLHLRGTLPDDYDSAAFHLNPDMRSTIERGSAAMAALLNANVTD